MKTKTLMLMMAVILIFIGCNKNDNNPLSTPSTTEKISKIIIDRIGNIEAIPTLGSQVLSTQEALDIAISDLEESVNAINDNAHADKEQMNLWINILKNTQIDFQQESILIYTFQHHSMCDYKEEIVESNSKINIILSSENEVCLEAEALYYMAYKVSKDIQQVDIKAFEHENVVVGMQ